MVAQMIIKNEINKKYVIKKLGITFRPLTEEEKTKVINKYEQLIFSRGAKKRINKYIEYNNIKDNTVELLKYFQKNKNIQYTEDEKTCNFLYCEMLKSNKKITKTYLKSQLRKIVIVEFDDNILNFSSENMKIFLLKQIIKTFFYAIKNYKYDEASSITVCNDTWDIDSGDLLINLISILNYTSTADSLITELNINNNDFDLLSDFFETLTKDRIRDFISVVDNLFGNKTSVENSIINKISIIERILGKYDKNYDMRKQLSLKFGICLHDFKTEIKGDDSKYIKYCYEVRSCIVHGNDIDLLEAPKKYLGLEHEYIKELAGSSKMRDKRFAVLFLAVKYLENNLNILIKGWMKNPKKIEYLKNN